MSKKIDFLLRQWQRLLTVGLPTLSTKVPELDAALTRLASYNRQGRIVSQKIIFLLRSIQCLRN